MRHAREEALNALEDVLTEVRTFDGLTERKRGAFYRKSAGFLHFHEDPAGLFADLKVDVEWQRFRVSTWEERAALLSRVEVKLGTARSGRSTDVTLTIDSELPDSRPDVPRASRNEPD